ncbi:YadA-like family protein [Stenotrophomonas maltophilia]|uniref:YadA-like family protein n=1 Tax=Stenotrophomonas maltophilia TaxID=40324 RepID=UPI001F52DE50|nr:YadA-like family protein [Stenotrophomonas maltophilia]MCI1140276.1 YadA-like family protein [Stenotrophomonas maltophilia]
MNGISGNAVPGILEFYSSLLRRNLRFLAIPLVLAGAVESSFAATGNGFVTVCQGSTGAGYSYGPIGSSPNVTCPDEYSFRVGNDGGLNGVGGQNNSAIVSGTVDGNLYLKGSAGVHVTGPATFGNSISLSGNKITGVSNGSVSQNSREVINGGQLWQVGEDWEARWSAMDSRISSIIMPVTDPGSVAIGKDAVVTQEKGTAIGDGSSVTGHNSVAVGAGSSATRDNEFSVGSEGNERVVSNVARGTMPNDAVNVGQMDDRFVAERDWSNSRFESERELTDSRFASEREWANSRFRSIDKRIDRMGAISAAYAGMAMNTAGLNGDNRLGAGIGSQGGRKALAVGYQRILGERKNASLSLGGAFSGSDRSISAGAGVSW